jgi:hypothetical protein
LRTRCDEQEGKIKEYQQELQKLEELKSKEEEREGKLKSLLGKTKKACSDARQQLTAKEQECSELQHKVHLSC